LIAAGVVLLWGDSKKDDHGYLSTGKERYAASTYALASDSLDVNLDGAGWIMDRRFAPPTVTTAATAGPARVPGGLRPEARARRPSPGISRMVTGRSSS
jgi:hypothetical protein